MGSKAQFLRDLAHDAWTTKRGGMRDAKRLRDIADQLEAAEPRDTKKSHAGHGHPDAPCPDKPDSDAGRLREGERWVIHFDDAEREHETFLYETSARKAFEFHKQNWNCVLFRSVDASPPIQNHPTPHAPLQAEPVREALDSAESALCDGLLGGEGSKALEGEDDACVLSVGYAKSVLAEIRAALGGLQQQEGE